MRLHPSDASRVMMPGGLGMPPFRAVKVRTDTPTVVFMRDDGWSLAAYPDSEAEAYESWRDKWMYFYVGPTWEPRPISEYKRPEDR